jgi:hypothetical protein
MLVPLVPFRGQSFSQEQRVQRQEPAFSGSRLSALRFLPKHGHPRRVESRYEHQTSTQKRPPPNEPAGLFCRFEICKSSPHSWPPRVSPHRLWSKALRPCRQSLTFGPCAKRRSHRTGRFEKIVVRNRREPLHVVVDIDWITRYSSANRPKTPLMVVLHANEIFHPYDPWASRGHILSQLF